MVIHVDLSEAVAEFGGKATLVVAEEGNEGFIAWEFQIGGDFLDVLLGIAEQAFCLLAKEPIDQGTGAHAEAFFTEAAQVVGRISEPLCYPLYAQGGIGIDADPLIDLFRRRIQARFVFR